MRKEKLILEAISLLKSLIKTPSFSSEEHHTALLIESWFQYSDISFNRTNNNIWAINKYFDETKPTLLLNSHHDTDIEATFSVTSSFFKNVGNYNLLL